MQFIIPAVVLAFSTGVNTLPIVIDRRSSKDGPLGGSEISASANAQANAEASADGSTSSVSADATAAARAQAVRSGQPAASVGSLSSALAGASGAAHAQVNTSPGQSTLAEARGAARAHAQTSAHPAPLVGLSTPNTDKSVSQQGSDADHSNFTGPSIASGPFKVAPSSVSAADASALGMASGSSGAFPSLPNPASPAAVLGGPLSSGPSHSSLTSSAMSHSSAGSAGPPGPLPVAHGTPSLPPINGLSASVGSGVDITSGPTGIPTGFGYPPVTTPKVTSASETRANASAGGSVSPGGMGVTLGSLGGPRVEAPSRSQTAPSFGHPSGSESSATSNNHSVAASPPPLPTASLPRGPFSASSGLLSASASSATSMNDSFSPSEPSHSLTGGPVPATAGSASHLTNAPGLPSFSGPGGERGASSAGAAFASGQRAASPTSDGATEPASVNAGVHHGSVSVSPGVSAALPPISPHGAFENGSSASAVASASARSGGTADQAPSSPATSPHSDSASHSSVPGPTHESSRPIASSSASSSANANRGQTHGVQGDSLLAGQAGDQPLPGPSIGPGGPRQRIPGLSLSPDVNGSRVFNWNGFMPDGSVVPTSASAQAHTQRVAIAHTQAQAPAFAQAQSQAPAFAQAQAPDVTHTQASEAGQGPTIGWGQGQASAFAQAQAKSGSLPVYASQSTQWDSQHGRSSQSFATPGGHYGPASFPSSGFYGNGGFAAPGQIGWGSYATQPYQYGANWGYSGGPGAGLESTGGLGGGFGGLASGVVGGGPNVAGGGLGTGVGLGWY